MRAGETETEKNERDALKVNRFEAFFFFPTPATRVFVIVTGVKLVSQMLMMKWVKCNEFYRAHKWLTRGLIIG